MVSTTEGWLTYTCWKRRSSAGSFSMCFRYSSCCAHAPSAVVPAMPDSDHWQQDRATPVA